MGRRERERALPSPYTPSPIPLPAAIPKAEFKLQPWSEKVSPPTRCQADAAKGVAPPKDDLAELSVGMLTHEPRSMADSLATYEANGLFDAVPEFLVRRAHESGDVRPSPPLLTLPPAGVH